jgi:hypothetical protein
LLEVWEVGVGREVVAGGSGVNDGLWGGTIKRMILLGSVRRVCELQKEGHSGEDTLLFVGDGLNRRLRWRQRGSMDKNFQQQQVGLQRYLAKYSDFVRDTNKY